MDYSRNAKYFKPKPSVKTMGIILVVGLISAFFTVGIGLVIAIVIVVMMNSGRPADQEIDQAAIQLSGGLKQRALDELGLDEDQVKEIPPVSFWGWNFGESSLDDAANRNAMDVCGKDLKWRSPIIDITWLFFTKTEIRIYKKTCSLVSNLAKEDTETYYYKKIDNVKTQSKDVQLVDRRTNQEIPGQKVKMETIMWNTMGGDKVYLSVQDSILAKNTVAAVRNLVNEKNN